MDVNANYRDQKHRALAIVKAWDQGQDPDPGTSFEFAQGWLDYDEARQGGEPLPDAWKEKPRPSSMRSRLRKSASVAQLPLKFWAA